MIVVDPVTFCKGLMAARAVAIALREFGIAVDRQLERDFRLELAGKQVELEQERQRTLERQPEHTPDLQRELQWQRTPDLQRGLERQRTPEMRGYEIEM
jgi:hypothetical protein